MDCTGGLHAETPTAAFFFFCQFSLHGLESVVRVFFLWWPMLSMNMGEINISKLLEFVQASNRQLLHLFSQS